MVSSLDCFLSIARNFVWSYLQFDDISICVVKCWNKLGTVSVLLVTLVIIEWSHLIQPVFFLSCVAVLTIIYFLGVSVDLFRLGESVLVPVLLLSISFWNIIFSILCCLDPGSGKCVAVKMKIFCNLCHFPLHCPVTLWPFQSFIKFSIPVSQSIDFSTMLSLAGLHSLATLGC